MLQEIKGRDDTHGRFAVYRARIPKEWVRHDPLPNESLADSTKAICEFIIKDSNEMIRIAIHNFPCDPTDSKPPPAAQVARWQRQFLSLSATDSYTVPQVFNGFTGLFFKGIGEMKREATIEDITVLAWALQIAPEHHRMLSYPPQQEQAPIYREMRADVTIKAVGPQKITATHEEDIINFAHSFELIEEIPVRR